MKHRAVLVIILVILAVSPASAQNEVFISDLAWSPDDTRLAVATSQGVKVYDVTTAEARSLWEVDTEQPVNVVSFNPSGNWLVAGLGSGAELNVGSVSVWNASTGEVITTFQANTFRVSSLAFSPDNQQLATGGGYFPTRAGGDYFVRLWDTSTWQQVPDVEVRGGGIISSIAFSPDGQFLAFSSSQSPTYILDAQTVTPVSTVYVESADCIIFNENSSRLTLGFYRSVQVWELRTEPEIHLVRQSIWSDPYEENLGEFLLGEYVIGCSPDVFATSTSEGVLRVRDTETAEVEFTYTKKDTRFTVATFSSDGSRLAFIADTNVSPISQDYRADNRAAIWSFDRHVEPIFIDMR